MDKYNLICFTFARMDDDNSASCGKTTRSISREKQKTAGGPGCGTGKQPHRQVQLQEEMTTNVAEI